MNRLTPTPEQEAAIQRIVNEPTLAALDASKMGAGKTCSAVEVAIRLKAKRVLLIAPLGTRVGWEKTFQRQGSALPFRWVNNNTKAGKAAYADYEWGVEGIYYVSPELFARMGMNGNKRTDAWSHSVDLAIFDEVHRASNRKTKTAKALQGIKTDFKLAMSGTPGGNSSSGLYSILRWLWPDRNGAGDIADRSAYRWEDSWCAMENDYFAPRGKRVVGEREPGKLVSMLPCYIRTEPPVGVDLIEETLYVELTPKQRKIYNQLEQSLMAWLDSGPLVVELPIALRIRARQITLGEPMIADDGSVDFDLNCHSSKLDTLDDMLPELRTALVFTDSAKFAKVAEERIRRKGYAVERWDGSVSQVKREEIKARFMAGETSFLVAVIPAMAEGVDGAQYGTSNVVWLSKSDNGVLNDQALARVHRQGQASTVTSYNIVATDTFDEGQWSSLIENKLARLKELALSGAGQ